FPTPSVTPVDVAPPRSAAQRGAAAKRAHADRVRASRDRAKVRAHADWSIVQAMLDLQAEHRPAVGEGIARAICLHDVARRAKSTMIAIGYTSGDAGRAICARIDPRQQGAAPVAVTAS
ncbi:hypothetical protein, partial [Methylobacterium sp. WL6]|uniref:hypothetical protein n=1 Tax=Methylobacterium sp. WL6 TaxID=2603901 RepID=UPI00164EFC3E